MFTTAIIDSLSHLGGYQFGFYFMITKGGGLDIMLVIMDKLTKYAHFLLIKHPYIAKLMAERFVREVVKLLVILVSIVSDRDPTFTSHFWKELFRLQGTTLRMSTSYHLKIDGETNMLNRILETYLHCFAVEQPKSWISWLHWAKS